MSNQEIQQGKLYAVVAYMGFLCTLGLLFKKDNPYAQYHVKQGLVLFCLEVGVFLLTIIPVFFWLKIAGLVVFPLVSAWGMVQAGMNRCVRIPLVSGVADKIII